MEKKTQAYALRSTIQRSTKSVAEQEHVVHGILGKDSCGDMALVTTMAEMLMSTLPPGLDEYEVFTGQHSNSSLAIVSLNVPYRCWYNHLAFLQLRDQPNSTFIPVRGDLYYVSATEFTFHVSKPTWKALGVQRVSYGRGCYGKHVYDVFASNNNEVRYTRLGTDRPIQILPDNVETNNERRWPTGLKWTFCRPALSNVLAQPVLIQLPFSKTMMCNELPPGCIERGGFYVAGKYDLEVYQLMSGRTQNNGTIDIRTTVLNLKVNVTEQDMKFGRLLGAHRASTFIETPDPLKILDTIVNPSLLVRKQPKKTTKATCSCMCSCGNHSKEQMEQKRRELERRREHKRCKQLQRVATKLRQVATQLEEEQQRQQELAKQIIQEHDAKQQLRDARRAAKRLARLERKQEGNQKQERYEKLIHSIAFGNPLKAFSPVLSFLLLTW